MLNIPSALCTVHCDISLYQYITLSTSEILPVAHFCIHTSATIKTWAVRVRRAGHVLALSGQAATQSSNSGRDRNQGCVPTIQNRRSVTKRHPAGTATCGTTVCIVTLIHTHLQNAHTESRLQLKDTERHRLQISVLVEEARSMQKMKC